MDNDKEPHMDSKPASHPQDDKGSGTLEDKSVASQVDRVTTEKVDGIVVSKDYTSAEVNYTPVGIVDGTGVNTDVQIIAVNSEESGEMIEGEMIELVIPEDGTDVPRIVTIETSKVDETNS